MSRVVWVLGASSGIGRAAAQQLSVAGDHVILSSRGKAALEITAQECRELGAASVSVAVVDVKDAVAVHEIAQEVIAEHGRLDAVMHAAGVVAYGRFEDIPTDVFDAVLDTNVKGAANAARAVLPLFRQQGKGSLVIVGSVLGNVNVPTMTPYVVSKWALRSFGRQLALENRDLPNVRISLVSPGGVDTPIYQQGATYLGRRGRPPAPVNSADSVAEAMVRALDHPKDRISVGPLNPLMRAGFTFLPKVFDAIVGPLFSVAALKPGPRPASAGNVFEAVDDLEARDAGEGQGLRDVAGRLRGR